MGVSEERLKPSFRFVIHSCVYDGSVIQRSVLFGVSTPRNRNDAMSVERLCCWGGEWTGGRARRV
jgi:hypothetical protein